LKRKRRRRKEKKKRGRRKEKSRVVKLFGSAPHVAGDDGDLQYAISPSAHLPIPMPKFLVFHGPLLILCFPNL